MIHYKPKAIAHKLFYQTLGDGGSTIDSSLSSPEGGYVVGGASKVTIISKKSFTEQAVLDFVLSIGRLVGGYYYGLREGKGKYYLEVSELFSDLKEATRVAKEREQIAIYDITNNLSIYTNEQTI